MSNLQNVKSIEGNLKITGNSTAKGGEYDQVKIVGEAVIDGDVSCKQLRCTGNLNLLGGVNVIHMGVTGNGIFSGRVEADSVKVTGAIVIQGNAKLKKIHGSGELEIHKNLQCEHLGLWGHLIVKGNCEAGEFTAKGMFNIDGLLNAGKLDIKLYRDSQIGEIGGEQIRIKRGGLLNPLNLFFKPNVHAGLTTTLIEGDHIEIWHTKAHIVRGNHVIIGSGCEIDLVEYKGKYEQSKDAVVKQKLKVMFK